MIKYMVIGLAVLFTSCNHTPQKAAMPVKRKNKPRVLSTYPDSLYTDTLKLSGKQMVFFMPTQKEFDTIVEKEGEDSGTNEIVGDFGVYMNQVVDSLKKSPWLKTTITDKHIITITFNNGHTMSVNRTKGITLVGTILCDDVKRPQIDYGVATSGDYWIMIDEYYGKD
ncbi:MAG: hypothetical protein V4592_17265 [Bacteroidota bacterium]